MRMRLLLTVLSSSLLVASACTKRAAPIITTPCKAGDVIYTSGQATGGSAADVARSEAMHNARIGVARLGIGTADGKGQVVLRGVEVPVVGKGADGKPWALARVRSERAAGLRIAECSAAVTAHTGLAPEGCPTWTGRGVMVEGEGTFAVGSAVGTDAAAESKATERAWIELDRLGQTAVSLAGKPAAALMRLPAAGAEPKHEAEQVQCAGSTWVRLSLR